MRNSFQSTSLFAILVTLVTVAFPLSEVVAQSTAPKTEKELLAVLRSDAPKAEKALACKNLSVYGSKEAVGDLAKLLGDEQLASWARTPLEAIPGDEANEALRKASESLKGQLLVGVIN